jgi:hypothetical protein
MAWSPKASDLLRDPRWALHGAVADPDSGEGELKLNGCAVEVGDQTRNRCDDGWWTKHPTNVAVVFVLDIERASFISWDITRGEMTAKLWSSANGYRETRRSYP